MKIVTDTATLVIYDVSQLKHRLDDGVDWWLDLDEEIDEINKGNVLFVGLSEDGAYDIDISKEIVGDELEHSEDSSDSDSDSDFISTSSTIQAILKNTSGRFYIGPGESVTSEGEEPVESVAGHFFNVTPGSYQVSISSVGNNIKIRLLPITIFTENNFEESPVLYDNDASEDELVYYDDTSEIVDSMCSHLEKLGYECEPSDIAYGETSAGDEEGEEIIYFHEEYGYLMIEEYEGGVRLYTAIEYDPIGSGQIGSDQENDLEWRTKLYMVLDYFNAASTVAKAYDDPDANQIIIDVWHPAVYVSHAFEIFIDHWHDDITVQLEDAENDIFGDHVLH